jgi:hypothetical protein
MHYNLNCSNRSFLPSRNDSHQILAWGEEQLINHTSVTSLIESDFKDVENQVERSGTGIVFMAMDG